MFFRKLKAKYLAIATVALLATQMIACGPSADTIKAQNEADSLAMIVSQKDSIINDAFTDIDLIASTLNDIATHQNIVTAYSASGEITRTKRAQIVDNLSIINDLLEANRRNIGSLNATSKKLKAANVRVEALETLVASLEAQIANKDVQIDDLLEQVEKLNIAVVNLSKRTSELESDNTVLEGTVATQDSEINTVYYAVGEERALIKLGLIDKKGFITVKRSLKNTDDLTKYTAADRRELKRVAIGGKRAKLISSHPEGSYTLIEGKKRVVEELIITNSKLFWRNSNFLVISYK